jgi:hypothetical protein
MVMFKMIKVTVFSSWQKVIKCKQKIEACM